MKEELGIHQSMLDLMPKGLRNMMAKMYCISPAGENVLREKIFASRDMSPQPRSGRACGRESPRSICFGEDREIDNV